MIKTLKNPFVYAPAVGLAVTVLFALLLSFDRANKADAGTVGLAFFQASSTATLPGTATSTSKHTFLAAGGATSTAFSIQLGDNSTPRGFEQVSVNLALVASTTGSKFLIKHQVSNADQYTQDDSQWYTIANTATTTSSDRTVPIFPEGTTYELQPNQTSTTTVNISVKDIAAKRYRLQIQVVGAAGAYRADGAAKSYSQ